MTITASRKVLGPFKVEVVNMGVLVSRWWRVVVSMYTGYMANMV